MYIVWLIKTLYKKRGYLIYWYDRNDAPKVVEILEQLF